MEQEEKTPTMLNHAAKWGVINGAIGIVIYVALYVIDYTLMANWKFSILGLLIALAVISYACVDYRNSIGGYLTYGKAWQYSFVALAIGSFISILFMILLYHVIDPEMPAKMLDASIEAQRKMLEGFGMQEDQIEKAIEEGRPRMENQFSIGGQALGFLFSLIFCAILALVTAIFGKRTPPVEQM